MFPERFFPTRYFAPRYWPKTGAAVAVPAARLGTVTVAIRHEAALEVRRRHDAVLTVAPAGDE